MRFHLFLPQMRLSFEQLVERARAAEAAGFEGIAGMDHLAPPMAEQQPMYEAMLTNAWLAAHTSTLTISSLVLCDAFRHPAMLAREAVTLDHASDGRYELGIGWGSVPAEFAVFGTGSTEPKQRVARLRETLEVVTALWAGETVDYDGEFHHLAGAFQAPAPTRKIPIVIGGSGPKTMALVATYADWWNLHTGLVDRVEELRPQAGTARVSIQQQIAFVPSEDERQTVSDLARKRFGPSVVVGSSSELVDHYAGLADKGVERVYAWFTDFAPPETLARFGAEVLPHLA